MEDFSEKVKEVGRSSKSEGEEGFCVVGALPLECKEGRIERENRYVTESGLAVALYQYAILSHIVYCLNCIHYSAICDCSIMLRNSSVYRATIHGGVGEVMNPSLATSSLVS